MTMTTSETKLIRVPAKFFGDHEDRDCEPYCDPVKRSSRFVWLRPDDEGLDELLDDAKHYAFPDMFGDEYGGLVRSAKATVKAIESARKAVQS
jgi:hypothetical protein